MKGGLDKLIFFRGSVLIIVLTFVVYGNSLWNNYALDDDYVTTTNLNNPHPKVSKGISGIPEIFTSYYINSDQQNFEYRPIVLSSFAVEYSIFGSNPHVSHFFNVLIYSLTCVLLFWVLLHLFREYHYFFSITITLLFLLHPIHTEVVNSLKGRDELLSFFFGLLGIFFFLSYLNTNKLKHLFLVFICFLIALLSKKSAVLFFALPPLISFFFYQEKIKKILLYIVLPITVFVVFKLIKFYLLEGASNERAYVFYENPLFFDESWRSKVILSLYTLGYYTKLMFFPIELNSYYGYEVLDIVKWNNWFLIVSTIIHLAAFLFALKHLKKKHILSFSIFIYFIGVFPFLNFYTPVVGIVGERFVYFASLGFSVTLVYLLFQLFKVDLKNKSTSIKYINKNFKFCLIVIFIGFSLKVYTRNKDWRNELTLFRADVETFENSCNLNYILANAISKEIQQTKDNNLKNQLIKEAKIHYGKTAELMKKGLEFYPKDFVTTNNLARIYVDIFNQPQKALPLFKFVVENQPQNKEARFNYAYCFEQNNQIKLAIQQYQSMLNDSISYLPAYKRLYELQFKIQEYHQAIEDSKRAIELFPNQVALYINVGNAYMYAKDTLSGLDYFEKATAIPPLDYVLLRNVADVFKVVGNTEKYEEYYKKSEWVFKNNNHATIKN